MTNRQPELDLAGTTVESHWNRLAREEAKNWTEDAKCIGWLCPNSDWRNHKQWWDGLPEYERVGYLNAWRSRRRGETYTQVRDHLNSRYEDNKAFAAALAVLIRNAAKRGEPMPIQPAPGFAYIVDWACELAGVLVIEARDTEKREGAAG